MPTRNNVVQPRL